MAYNIIMSSHKINLRLPLPGNYTLERSSSERPITSSDILNDYSSSEENNLETTKKIANDASAKSIQSINQLKDKLYRISLRMKIHGTSPDLGTYEEPIYNQNAELIKLRLTVKKLEEDK